MVFDQAVPTPTTTLADLPGYVNRIHTHIRELCTGSLNFFGGFRVQFEWLS